MQPILRGHRYKLRAYIQTMGTSTQTTQLLRPRTALRAAREAPLKHMTHVLMKTFSLLYWVEMYKHLNYTRDFDGNYRYSSGTAETGIQTGLRNNFTLFTIKRCYRQLKPECKRTYIFLVSSYPAPKQQLHRRSTLFSQHMISGHKVLPREVG